MPDDDRMRLGLTVLIGGMVNAVLFGTGLIALLSSPLLDEASYMRASWCIALLVAACLIASPPIAWAIAPRLRARYWRNRHPDFIAG